MPEWLIWFLILSWAGPIGLGAFLAGLGVFYWGQGYDRRSKKE